MDDFNPCATSQHDLPPAATACKASGGGFWRDGELLLMRLDAALPDRCVKCNAPAEGCRLKLTLPGLLSLPVFLLGTRLRPIQIGLCPRHRRRIVLEETGFWFLLILSASATFVGINRFDVRVPLARQSWLVLGLLVGGVSVFTCVAIFGWLLEPLKLHRFKDGSPMQGGYFRLKKVDPGYLAQLPPFDGSSEFG